MFGFLKKTKEKITKGLAKTTEAIKSVIPEKKEKYPKDVIEEILIESDIDYELVEGIVNRLPDVVAKNEIK
jgi:fused signal recognition particle receptor